MRCYQVTVSTLLVMKLRFAGCKPNLLVDLQTIKVTPNQLLLLIKSMHHSRWMFDGKEVVQDLVHQTLGHQWLILKLYRHSGYT